MRRGDRKPGLLAKVIAFASAGVAVAAGAAPAVELAPPARPSISWELNDRIAITPPLPPSVSLPSHPLTLAELTDLALLNNPRTREVWAAARAEAAALGIAESAFFPTLDAIISVSRGNSASGGSQTRISPSISLSYVLFDFGARAASAEAARYTLLASNLAHNRALQDVVLRVEQAYYQLLGARQTIVAAEESLRTAQVSFDAADARRQAGLATVGDVYQAQTALAQARLALQRANGDTTKFKGELASAVGLPVNSAFEVAAAGELPLREVKSSVDEYLLKARASRPDLVAAEAEFRAARARVDAAQAQGRPSIELGANVGRSYVSGANDSSNNSIGLNLRIPLFNGYRTRYSVEQAEARAEQLAATRERIAREVELDVWQAYSDLETANVQIDSARALLQSATLSRQVAQERYRAGVGNVIELLSAQAAEADARVQVIQAELGWYSALSRLNNAIGIFSASTGS